MKKTRSAAALAAVFAVMASAGADAQTRPIQASPPPPRYELDPAKRVPVAAPVEQAADAPARQASPTRLQPAYQGQPSSVTPDQPYSGASEAQATYEEGRGGFFIGVQGGKGWVYDDVDQSALSVNAGYRWQAGAVSLIGIELASGKLDSTTDDSVPYSEVDYASVGVNARFNFGRNSPVYGLVRAGSWAADGDYGMDVDGGYFGLGLGADVNRHFNVSLVYTNYVYFDEYSWSDYDVSRADTLMLGAEVRF